MMFYLFVHIILVYCNHPTDADMIWFTEFSPGEAESIGCPENWSYIPWDNQCVRLFLDQNMKWEEGNAFCKSQINDGEIKTGLLSITHAVTLETIKQMIPDGSSFWIGYNGSDIKDQFSWLTSDERHIPNMSVEPPSSEENQCVLLSMTGLQLNVKQRTCDDLLPVICEIANANACKMNNGGCGTFCYPNGLSKRACACLPTFEMDSNFKCVKATDPCTVSNGGCDQICKDRQCSCREGFNLVGDKKCEDIDECLLQNGGCEHKCVNTDGSWNCSCNESFTKDGTYCRYNVTGRAVVHSREGWLSPNVQTLVGSAVTLAVLFAGCILVAAQYSELKRQRARLTLVEGMRNRRLGSWFDDDHWDTEVHVDENEVRDLSTITDSTDDEVFRDTRIHASHI